MSDYNRSHLTILRDHIEAAYRDHPTGCGGSFGELLCWEIHTNGLTFGWLAEKWGVSLPTLGELIWDHCKRLEPLPVVNYAPPEPASHKAGGEPYCRLCGFDITAKDGRCATCGEDVAILAPASPAVDTSGDSSESDTRPTDA